MRGRTYNPGLLGLLAARRFRIKFRWYAFRSNLGLSGGFGVAAATSSSDGLIGAARASRKALIWSSLLMLV